MACRLAGLSRSAYRRPLQGETTADPDLALRDWLRAYAKKHPRWGYRRAYHDARGEGWVVNHKKIQRLWREEGLRVPQRRRRKRVGSSTVDAPAAVAPKLVWAVDFQFDADEQGRPIKICSIVDEHTRECIGGLVERSITADRLTAHLEDLVAVRGAPAVLRSDNGPEFISDAMADWAGTRTGLFYIPPGSPWHNGYVESFNSRLRDECLNINSFYSLLHAQVVIGGWKTEYNHDRRHSSLGYLRSATSHPSTTLGNAPINRKPTTRTATGPNEGGGPASPGISGERSQCSHAKGRCCTTRRRGARPPRNTARVPGSPRGCRRIRWPGRVIRPMRAPVPDSPRYFLRDRLGEHAGRWQPAGLGMIGPPCPR